MHLVIIEDAIGDAVDANIYCSDWCAQTDDAYAGWNGCHELDYTSACANCYRPIEGYTD